MSGHSFSAHRHFALRLFDPFEIYSKDIKQILHPILPKSVLYILIPGSYI